MSMHDPTTVSDAVRVRKTVTSLADGRELIYFDDSPPYVTGDRTRDLVDTRPLAPASSDAQMRYDVLTGEWVVIAAERMDRTFLPPPDSSPLAPSRPGRPTEIPAEDYDVVVFENRFPSLSRLSTCRARSTTSRCGRSPRAPGAARWCASPATPTPASPR